MTTVAIPEPVADAFASYDPALRTALARLRALIYEAAEDLPQTGGIEETLKWGQPSYLPRRARVGTTVRLGPAPGDPSKAAVFVHCQTGLVETYRHVHPELTYSGNRAVIVDPGVRLPEDALRHCIRMALTYHMEKRRRA